MAFGARGRGGPPRGGGRGAPRGGMGGMGGRGGRGLYTITSSQKPLWLTSCVILNILFKWQFFVLANGA